jgi:hypothetical protein
MTHGAVIFAQNNGAVDYVKLATFSAKQLQKHLSVPVTLITDTPSAVTEPDVFDNVIVIENSSRTQLKKFNDGVMSSKHLEWKNYSRSQIYELTPYDKTLVIDSDFIINSSILKLAFDVDSDFQIYQKSFDLAGWRNTSSFERLNQYAIPFYWATAFVFEKNDVTKSFFDLVSHIKENWEYYRLLYTIDTKAFRNDFAFSIAIHIMNNSTTGDFATILPGNMTYTLDSDLLVSMVDNKMQFLVEKEGYYGEYTLVKTTGLDVHVMNKYSLLRFIEGGQGV